MKLFILLRIFRAFKGLKLKELAEEIGITPRELSALEDGRKPASGATLAALLRWVLEEESPTDGKALEPHQNNSR